MTGQIGLLDVLHRIPAHVQERSDILDSANTRKFYHKTAETVGISTFTRDEMKTLLTDGTALLTFNTPDFHVKLDLFMPDGNTTDRAHGISGTDNMLAFTARTTKFVRTGLDIQDNAIIFVAYSCAFLLTDAKGVVQKAGIHCYCLFGHYNIMIYQLIFIAYLRICRMNQIKKSKLPFIQIINNKFMYKNSPKVFISYSWHPEENKQSVEELARRLMDDGVYVVIDIWDLHAGQDKNAYMERMVSDPTVDKVLLICNKEYAEKANTRQGGVGIESTIISEEVYSKVDQTKFIPIVFEKDENGNAYKPVFVKSRIHYDLSDENIYEKDYDELLRDLYQKPKSQRPFLGKMPEYLNEDNPTNLSTAHKVTALRKSIIKDDSNVKFLIDDYLDTFVKALNVYKVDYHNADNDNFISLVESNIASMQPLKHDFIDFVDSIAKSKECTGRLFVDFFEKWLQFYENEGISLLEDNSTDGVANDHFRFFNYDVFLSFAAIMLENSRYDVLHEVVTSPLYVERLNYRADSIMPCRFMTFRKYNYTLDQYKNERYTLRRVSVTADLVSQYAKRLDMRSLVQTDILLYYLSLIYPSTSLLEGGWFPTTGCYNHNVEILPRLVSKRYFENVKMLFGVNNVTEFKTLLDGVKSKNISDIYYHIPSIKQGLLYDKACSME